jgi:nucleoside-diphosphate-sugar epimerase
MHNQGTGHSRALVVGVSGIVGANLADYLISEGCEVYGLSRRPTLNNKEARPVAVDLREAKQVRAALADIYPSHVFLTTWLRQATEAENCAVNGAMVRNVLTALRGHRVQHVALVTGLKHYLGPVEAQGRVAVPDTPFREDEPRLPVENFYYVQEDKVFAAAEEQGFTWSVHRPHTIIGYALGNAMNIGVTLAVAAIICRESGRPFIFPGSTTQWKSLKDMTDARLLALHLAWASTADNAKNEAFNVVNGDIFRWRRMWSRIAEYFGVEPVAPSREPYPFEQQMADAAPIWEDIVHRYGLAESDLDRLVSWWHTDGDLGRDIECVTDMSKSRDAGFLDYVHTDQAFFDLFERLRAERIIP